MTIYWYRMGANSSFINLCYERRIKGWRPKVYTDNVCQCLPCSQITSEEWFMIPLLDIDHIQCLISILRYL